jgi:3-oxoacyl-(acyl-carrier-protein) synthase
VTAVAITGIGVVSGFGLGAAPFWEGLVAGRSAVRPLGRARVPGVDLGAEAPALDVRAFARSPLGRRIDRTSLLALAACRLALADAGEPLAAVPADRRGLVLGSALGNLGETETFLDRLFARGAGIPLVFPNLVMNAPLSYASIELEVTGPTAFVSEGEVSGEAAIACGADLVADGAADLCLAGGADELDGVLCEVLRDAGAFRGGARPGEGAAVLVLEPLERARARGARVYARLAPHPGFSVPCAVHGWPAEPAAVAAGLAGLLADADLVVAAANGRAGRDRVEAAALARALDGRRPAVTAPRAAFGDFGAAGALAAAAAVLAVATDTVPPASGPAGTLAALGVVRGAARRVPVRAAVVSALARGGLCRPVRVEAAG